MRFFPILCLFFAISSTVMAQENLAIIELLQEAEAKLYKQPEQSGKISEYVIGQNDKNDIITRATLLLAKSFYVRGHYNDAIKNSLKAKKMADLSSNKELKAQSIAFAIQLLQLLGLTSVADDYSQELTGLEKEIRDPNTSLWVSGNLKQHQAYIAFEQGNSQSAIELAKQAKALFSKVHDTAATAGADILLSDVYIKSHQLNSALPILEKLLDSVNNFHKIHVLNDLGSLYFGEKEYSRSVAFFEKALAQATALPNREYQNNSLKGLAQGYLALEDSKKFFLYKQKANILSSEIETDKTSAINSVYNFINSFQKERSHSQQHRAFIWVYILGALFILVVVSGILMNYLYTSKTREYKAIYRYISPESIQPTPQPKNEMIHKSSLIPEETEQLLLKKLDKFEAGKKFTNPDMSIAFLASQFDTNTKYLSEVINRNKGKNFNSYINELRINYIIGKLRTDPTYFNYKISYLAEESGFSSHSSFATVFKSVTGISPTKFMELLKERAQYEIN